MPASIRCEGVEKKTHLMWYSANEEKSANYVHVTHIYNEYPKMKKRTQAGAGLEHVVNYILRWFNSKLMHTSVHTSMHAKGINNSTQTDITFYVFCWTVYDLTDFKQELFSDNVVTKCLQQHLKSI